MCIEFQEMQLNSEQSIIPISTNEKKRSNEVKPGKLGGNITEFPRPVHFYPDIVLRRLLTTTVKCGCSSVRNHYSRRAFGKELYL